MDNYCLIPILLVDALFGLVVAIYSLVIIFDESEVVMTLYNFFDYMAAIASGGGWAEPMFTRLVLSAGNSLHIPANCYLL